MTVTFHIDYRTKWGEILYLVFSGNPHISDSGTNQLAMTYAGDGHWTASLTLPDRQAAFEYGYMLRDESGFERHEWKDTPHVFVRPLRAVDTEVYDHWSNRPDGKVFYSSAFSSCICRREPRDKALRPAKGRLMIAVNAPMVLPTQTLAVCGSCDSLGKWDCTNALRMNDHSFPAWSVTVPAADISADAQYKFVILDKATDNVVTWEEGDNRHIGITPDDNKASVIAGLQFRLNPASWKGAGTAIPVFSIRTENDFGVGDFGGLRAMTDWCAATGQTFLQLLPINDTTMTGTWTDSYPYNANSTFALHPMYLDLNAIGTIKDTERRQHYARLAKELNALAEIDYERVNKGKLAFARDIFDETGDETLSSSEFKSFFKRNAYWLEPYAAFCVLRDKFGTPDYNMWGEYAVYSRAKQKKVLAANRTESGFIYFLQFHLDRQMHAAKDYANSKGVAIKGDIPIGISRTSADAWINPRLFNLDSQAGAPPDDFSILGQNWGFPTYNWDEMKRDGFAWWKARFKKMSEYFDAYRIDHVLGFFRIWQIPMDALHGLLGFFNPALPFEPDELKGIYGFYPDPASLSHPVIKDSFLHDFFGEYTDEARCRFFDSVGDGHYTLKHQFATQRRVAGYFEALDKSEKNTLLCNALLELIDNVLFIEDPYRSRHYHPRIAAQSTLAYQLLDEHERKCFDRMYNDFFYHRHNSFWYENAMLKLPPLIDATDMLACAEDLGMIPACVSAVMQQLEILSLEIQRMPKDSGKTFGDTMCYPYLSVCTTSTHDMGGIRQWWEENRELTQRFYNDVLHHHGEAPHTATPFICSEIIDLHLKSPSMLCILPLQDWLASDGNLRRDNAHEEQINCPANPRHYWRYRMHLDVGQLIAAHDFNKRIKQLIESSGRH